MAGRGLIFSFLLGLWAVPSWPCQSELQLLSRLPAPIGLSRASFDGIVEVIRYSSLWSKAEALVFRGSRTHFNYGYRPHDKSDLDVQLIPSVSMTPMELMEFRQRTKTLVGKALLERDKERSDGTSISVDPGYQWLIDPSVSLLLQENRLPTSEIDREVENRVREQRLEEDDIKAQYHLRFAEVLEEMGLPWILYDTTEMIFVFRERAVSSEVIENLKARGFSHVLVLP